MKNLLKKDGFYSFLSSMLVIIVGLLIGLVILFISNSENAWEAFMTILTSGFSSMRITGDVLLQAAPIIMTGLAVAFAFKTGLFNIGATGQFTMGAFVAIFIGVEFTFIPAPLRILLAVVAAALAGALWGAIPGLLKAFCNVHEVISSIMTNYIGMFLVNFMIINSIFDQPRGATTRLPVDSALPSFGMENIFTDEIVAGSFRPSNINIGIFIAIIIAILVYIILEKTTFGYELKACGFNKDAAKYAGINEKRNIVLSLMISGALAGLGGALMYLNNSGLSMSTIDTLAPQGFTGISVAFLGLSHPIAIIFSGTFISYISLGGARIQALGFSVELVEMVIAMIIYFCAFVSLVKIFLLNRFTKKSSLAMVDTPLEDVLVIKDDITKEVRA